MKHPNVASVKQLPFSIGDVVVRIPEPSGISRVARSDATLLQNFKMWITGVAESINSTLQPKVSGTCKAYKF